MKLDLTALVAHLKALDPSEIPAVLDAVKAALAKLSTDAASVAPFLQKFFPQLASLEPTLVADAKLVVDFLSAFEAKYLPYILKAIAMIAAMFPAAA